MKIVNRVDYQVIKVAIDGLLMYAGRKLTIVFATGFFILMIGKNSMQKALGRGAESKHQQQEKGDGFFVWFYRTAEM